MLWIGLVCLILLGLDIWNRRRTKYKTRNTIFLIAEGAGVIGCILWWLAR